MRKIIAIILIVVLCLLLGIGFQYGVIGLDYNTYTPMEWIFQVGFIIVLLCVGILVALAITD